MIRLPSNELDVRTTMASGWRLSTTFTYVVDIGDLAATWHGFDHDRRRLIRRAERLGYHVTESTDPSELTDNESLARLHRDQAETLGGRDDLDARRSQVLVPRLIDEGAARLFFAYDRAGTPVAAQLVAVDRRRMVSASRVVNLVTGVDRHHRDSGVNGLLRWEVMRAMHDDGVDVFDLNGARIGPTGRFKASFGGRLEPVWMLSIDDHASIGRLLGAVAYRIRTGIPYRASRFLQALRR